MKKRYIVLLVIGVPSLSVFMIFFCLWSYLFISLFPWLPDSRGDTRTALHAAAQRDDVAYLGDLLPTAANVDVPMANDRQWPDGVTPLMIAVSKGYTRSTKVLLDHGASISARDANGEQPIHWARSDAILMLLERGADLEAKCYAGHTPLMRAARGVLHGGGNMKDVETLLKAGASHRATNYSGTTAADIIRGIPSCDPAILKLLEEPGQSGAARD